MQLQDEQFQESYLHFCVKDNQALTQASSQINGGQGNSQITANQTQPKNKGQNKLKYRKLTQKLNTMGRQHEQKWLGNKDLVITKGLEKDLLYPKWLGNKEAITSNKQRIMKYVIDFERQLKSQNKDYTSLEAPLRQIYKLIQIKNEQDLHVLRNSKLVPVWFQFLQKIPSLHKNTIGQAMRVVEAGFKILHIFGTLSINRDYLIVTKRLQNLLSLTLWMINRDQKKPLYLSFKIMNCLLLHKTKDDSIKTIITTTVQLIIFSQLFKKIKILLQLHYLDDQIINSELITQILRFSSNIMKSKRQEQLQFNIQSNRQDQLNICPISQDAKVSSTLSQTIQLLLSFLTKFIISIWSQESNPQEMPYTDISVSYLIIKLINTLFELSFSLCKKQIDVESLLPIFLKITIYCKSLYDDKTPPRFEEKSLFNEVIILIGYIALDSQVNNRRIVQSLIFQQFCNLPTRFLMDSHLKDIIIPTMCTMMYSNKIALNNFLKQNCPQCIIRYLKKQISAKSTTSLLTRKNSTQSLYSSALGNQVVLGLSIEMARVQLINRFPEQYWEQICIELQRCAGIDG